MASTPNDQAFLNLLTDIRAQLMQLNRYEQKKEQDQTQKKRKNTGRNGTDQTKAAKDAADKLKKLSGEIDNVTDKSKDLKTKLNLVNKELEKSQKGTRSFSSELGETIKNTIIPGRKAMRDAFKQWSDSLSKNVIEQGDDYRKLAQGAQEFAKSGQKSVNAYRAVMMAQQAYAGIIKSAIKSQGILTSADRKRAEAILAAHDTLTKESQGRVDLLGNNNEGARAALVALAKCGKVSADGLAALTKSAMQVNKNFEVATNVTEHYNTTSMKMQEDLRTKFHAAMKDFIGGLRKATGEFLAVGVSDLRSQMRNAVPESRYAMLAENGMGSQRNFNEFIAQNRTELRSIGGGSAMAGADRTAQMVDQIRKSTGMGGDEAVKYLGSTMRTITNMGDSAANAGTAVGKFSVIAQRAGMSLDEFSDLAAEMSKSPAFLDLVRANGYGDPTKELNMLVSISRSTGFSMDYLKEMLEMSKQQKYSGIAETVKQQVGIDLMTSLLNSHGAHIGKGDHRLLRLMPGHGVQGVMGAYNNGLLDKMPYENGKTIKEAFPTAEEFNKHLNELVPMFNKEYVGVTNNLSGQLGMANPLFQTITEAIGRNMGLGPMLNQDAGITANAWMQGHAGSENPTDDVRNMLLGTKGTIVSSVDQVKNSFNFMGEKYNAWIAKLEDILGALGMNPVGAAFKSAGGAILGGAASGLGMWGASRLFGRMAMPSAALAAEAGGAASGLAGGIGGAALRSVLRPIPLVGGLASGALDYALTGKKGGAIGTALGTTIGAGLGSLIPIPGVGTVVGGLAGGYVGNKIGGLFDSDVAGPINSDKSGVIQRTGQSSADTTPEGETAVELLSKMNQTLVTINANTQKQLKVVQDNHDAYMDWLNTKSYESGVNKSRDSVAMHLIGGEE